MHEPDFSTGDAEFLELSIQGQRLIIVEIAEAMRGLWRRLKPPATRTSGRLALVAGRRALPMAAGCAGSRPVAPSRRY